MNETRKIPKIDSLVLPENYPTREAIQSWGQNEADYEPEIWALGYVVYRYLSGMSDRDLEDRYRSIVYNMRSYTGSARDRIPINSYQSSWYWFRKEYQTRLEFAMRHTDPPNLTGEPVIASVGGPENPAVPNGSDVIFRYGERKHMREMVDKGRIRFSPAGSYDGEDNNSARRDDELRKHAYMAGQYTTIVTQGGQRLKVIGDIQRTVTGPQYHLVCFSCVWKPQLYEEFQSDTCVAVTDPREFARRVERAGCRVFPGWYFHDNPVQYFDPHEQRKKEPFDAAMSKDFRFAYQIEYRILWSQLGAPPVDGYQFVEIGPAHDIMTMYAVDGEQLRL